jgi:two-component system NarL family response regulator
MQQPLAASKLIRIIVADDHVTVREGLAAIIGRQPDMLVVAEAANGEEAHVRWLEHRPDVLLLDLRMPVLDGIGAMGRIRSTAPEARIVVLTTFDTDSDIAGAIKGGAKGYLLKDAPREVLVETIRKVHAGATSIPAALVAKLVAGVGSEDLTEREREVLTLVARGMSNKELATSLAISETTVKTHLRSVFAKLRVLSRTEAIAAAIRRGLVQL